MPQLQTRMFTLRMTDEQCTRFRQLTNEAARLHGISANSHVLVALGLLPLELAKADANRHGKRGRASTTVAHSKADTPSCNHELS